MFWLNRFAVLIVQCGDACLVAPWYGERGSLL
jgi:hypothetical protein